MIRSFSVKAGIYRGTNVEVICDLWMKLIWLVDVHCAGQSTLCRKLQTSTRYKGIVSLPPRYTSCHFFTTFNNSTPRDASPSVGRTSLSESPTSRPSDRAMCRLHNTSRARSRTPTSSCAMKWICCCEQPVCLWTAFMSWSRKLWRDWTIILRKSHRIRFVPTSATILTSDRWSVTMTATAFSKSLVDWKMNGNPTSFVLQELSRSNHGWACHRIHEKVDMEWYMSKNKQCLIVTRIYAAREPK